MLSKKSGEKHQMHCKNNSRKIMDGIRNFQVTFLFAFTKVSSESQQSMRGSDFDFDYVYRFSKCYESGSYICSPELKEKIIKVTTNSKHK